MKQNKEETKYDDTLKSFQTIKLNAQEKNDIHVKLIETVEKSKPMKLKTDMRIMVNAILTGILILIGGYFLVNQVILSEDGHSGNATQDKNIETIEAVLQTALTGPNDELKKIFNSGGIEELVQYDKDHFEEYFANEASYTEFVNYNNGSGILIEAWKHDYKFKVKTIEYEKTESEEIIYDFTVEIEYQKEGSETVKVETVTGQANLNEEYKIEDMIIRIGNLLGSLE